MKQFHSYISSEFVEVCAVLTVTVVSFLIYHFTISSRKYYEYIDKIYGKKQAKIYSVIIQRLTGFFLYGIIPVFVIFFLKTRQLYSYGLNLSNINNTIFCILILSPFLVLINALNSKKSDNLAVYPQIRKKKWTKSLVILSALSWTVYLCAYEFLFRGFLLFGCFYAFGTVTAITINTCIYALVHVPKGIKETLGAVPLGIVLCMLTLHTGNIIIALVVHIVMALSNEWLSLRAHPKMKIVKHR